MIAAKRSKTETAGTQVNNVWEQRKEKQSGAEEEKVEGYLNLCRMNQQRRGGYYVSGRENNSRTKREEEREITQQKKKTSWRKQAEER